MCRTMKHTLLPRLLAALALLAAASAQAAIPPSQRQYLMDFYFATGGPNWTDHTGWGGPPGSECNWFGVDCDAGETTVTELDLNGNHLVSPVGVPVPDWSALPDLESLTVYNNQLAGPAPAIAGLAQLRFINIANNQFTGALPAPAGLQHLERYYALNNQFSGSLPPFDNLPALQIVGLRQNQFTGSIPSLAGAPSLEQLGLSYNQLTGSIPALPSGLTRLYVSYNQLTGPVPAAPNSLLTNDSQLCPNYLTPSVSNDWNVATGETPWHANCTAAPPGLGGGATALPTLGEWALALLSLAAAAMGFAALRRKQV
jgi:hypothetical protein